MRKMNPELAVAIGRDLETLDADTLDAGLVGLDEDRVGAGYHPQHFETQGRHGRALGLHDHRHPPDNTAAFGLDREQAAPGGRLFQHLDVAQQAGKIQHERLRFLAQHGEARHRQRLVELGQHIGKSGFAEHHARAPHRIGEDLIVARQRAQPGAHLLVEIADGVGRDVGIEPVGLREHDVEGDHDGAKPGEIGDEVRHARPRPWPLAEFRQALFVDIDNGDRPCGLYARVDALEAIEGSDPDLLDRRGVGDAQRREADQERQAHQPRIPDPPLEPPSQCPQPLHAISISRRGGLITFLVSRKSAGRIPRRLSIGGQPEIAVIRRGLEG